MVRRRGRRGGGRFELGGEAMPRLAPLFSLVAVALVGLVALDGRPAAGT